VLRLTITIYQTEIILKKNCACCCTGSMYGHWPYWNKIRYHLPDMEQLLIIF